MKGNGELHNYTSIQITGIQVGIDLHILITIINFMLYMVHGIMHRSCLMKYYKERLFANLALNVRMLAF